MLKSELFPSEKREKQSAFRQIKTYSSQSTATIRVTSLAGNPTAVKTITMVTSPALGTPAAPILATVAVILKTKTNKHAERKCYAYTKEFCKLIQRAN